ncbi:MAG: 50S ribosomal protein L3 N(5)-glutamine methyltransferase [Pseudohongiellaceae bacterium]
MDNRVSVQAYIEDLAGRFDAADLFFGHGTDNAYDEAVYFTFVLLGLSFAEPVDTAQVFLSQDQLHRLQEAATRRIKDNVPVAYLVGKAWFAGHEFISDERALVPRSPIAELINNEFSGLLHSEPQRILDMCTGSGCIGLAAALQYPQAKVDLVDVSEDALALAKSNIQLHKLGGRVSAISSDCFAEVSGEYDLILCNPPYVSAEEYADLPSEYMAEPQLGLVSQDNGLQLPTQLLEQAGNYLCDKGVLIMEVGFSDQALANALPQLPFLWLEFEHGGSGVFCLNASQLRGFSETRK